MLHKRRHEPKFKRLAWIGFAVSSLIVLYFGAKLVLSIIYWNDHAHQNQTIEPWMSVGYIARSYQIDRRALIDAIPYNLDQSKRKSLKDIAAENNMSVDALIAEIDAIIVELGSKRD